MKIHKLEYLENDKKLFRWNKKHFSQFLKDYHLVKTKSFIRNSSTNFKHCMHPPLSDGGRVEPPTRFSKRGGWTGPQLLEVVCWEREAWLYSEGVQFSRKNKSKSEIFNGKKVYEQKYFSFS